MYKFLSVGGCFILEIPGGDLMFFGHRSPFTVSGAVNNLRFQVSDIHGRVIDIKLNEVADYFGITAGVGLNTMDRRAAMQTYIENTTGMG